MGDGLRLIGTIDDLPVIYPNWVLPEGHPVQAFCTTRKGGFSHSPYNSLNLALHVGDDPKAVQQNRQKLQKNLKIPKIPSPDTVAKLFWLDQRHTTDAVKVALADVEQSTQPPVTPIADASWTTEKGVALVVMTADCMPILLTNRAGTVIVAIHAGWKGCLDGVIEQTMQSVWSSLPSDKTVAPAEWIAWIGPCIRQSAFEVGEEVKTQFCQKWTEAERYFTPIQTGKTHADLAGLGKLALNQIGIEQVFDSGLCSFELSEWFYSYRRDGQTGRMASVIFLS